jgi:hypothetical protein
LRQDIFLQKNKKISCKVLKEYSRPGISTPSLQCFLFQQYTSNAEKFTN